MRRQKALFTKQELIAAREGKNSAWKYTATQGKFGDATFPYAVLQIDHTVLDIVVVDDEGLPLGRVWFTVAIDVFSRCVVGFRVSLDPPSYAMVGLVLTRAILPKTTWLKEIDPELEKYQMPFYGRPDTVLVDNAKEFQSKAMIETCQRYNIELDWRPKGKPNYGAHVERLMGTFSRVLKVLPGATLKPAKVPDDYDPKKYASFTIAGLEKWLAHQIFGTYHHTEHAGIENLTPLAKFKKGLDEITGTLEVITGEQAKRLGIFFSPSFEASIVREGVKQFYIKWKSKSFNRIVAHFGTGDGNSHKTNFYFDPANMKRIYCVDPLDPHGRFIEAEYPINKPEYSYWEIQLAIKELNDRKKQSKNDPINQQAVFRALEAQRLIREQEAARIMKSRQQFARQKEDAKKRARKSAIDTTKQVKVLPKKKFSAPTPSGRAVRKIK